MKKKKENDRKSIKSGGEMKTQEEECLGGTVLN